MKDKIGYMNFLLILKREETVILKAVNNIVNLVDDSGNDMQAIKLMKVRNYVSDFDINQAKKLKKILISLLAPIIAAVFLLSMLLMVSKGLACVLMIVLAVIIVYVFFKLSTCVENISAYNQYCSQINEIRAQKLGALKHYYDELSNLELKVLDKVKEKNLFDEQYYSLFMYGTEDIDNKTFANYDKRNYQNSLLEYWEKIIGRRIEKEYLAVLADGLYCIQDYEDVINKNVKDFERIFAQLD